MSEGARAMLPKSNHRSPNPDLSSKFRLPRCQRGFSLLEMLVVVAVITVIMGAVLKSIDLTQKASTSEQVKLDLTQQAREFMDQITRDLRSVGYPNSRNMSQGAVDSAGHPLTYPATAENGVGLIKIDYNTLWFAGDIDGAANADGTAQVKIVKYDYYSTGTNCPCLRRTEYLRTSYSDPVQDAANATATAQMEIQGVQNGASAADPIFTAYDPTTGTAVTLPVDFTGNATTMAKINSLKVVLAVQSPYKDIVNGSYPVTRVISTIALSN